MTDQLSLSGRGGQGSLEAGHYVCYNKKVVKKVTETDLLSPDLISQSSQLLTRLSAHYILNPFGSKYISLNLV